VIPIPVVDVVDDAVPEVDPGTVVEVVLDEVVLDEVVVLGDEVVVVVEVEVDVLVVGATPFMTPPTVLPALGPPKIEDSERPVATSMRVTAPRASTKIPRAVAIATIEKRHRLAVAATPVLRSGSAATGPEVTSGISVASTSPTALVAPARRVSPVMPVMPVMLDRFIASWARAADWDIRVATVVATPLPIAAPTRVPLTPKTEATTAAATAAAAEAAISRGLIRTRKSMLVGRAEPVRPA